MNCSFLNTKTRNTRKTAKNAQKWGFFKLSREDLMNTVLEYFKIQNKTTLGNIRDLPSLSVFLVFVLKKSENMDS